MRVCSIVYMHDWKGVNLYSQNRMKKSFSIKTHHGFYSLSKPSIVLAGNVELNETHPAYNIAMMKHILMNGSISATNTNPFCKAYSKLEDIIFPLLK